MRTTLENFRDYIKSHNLNLSDILKSSRLFVEIWLKANNGIIEIDERGALKDTLGRDALAIFQTIYLDYQDLVSAHQSLERTKASNLRANITPIYEKDIQYALNEQINNAKLQYRADLGSSLKYEGFDSHDIVCAMVRAWTGEEDPKVVAIVKMWLWLVKRKMNGLPVTNHIMLILHGPQGAGKGSAIRLLTSVLRNFRLDKSLDEVGEPLHFKAMSENFIWYIEELAGVGRSDMNELKKQITTDANDFRQLYTHTSVKVPQNCSFIADTNHRVALQIFDSTGMRRFFEILCQPRMDWDVLNALDYMALWKGIDENSADGGILPFLGEIQKAQAELVTKTEIEEYLSERGYDATLPKTKRISKADLYFDYQTWATACGIKNAKTKLWFGRELNLDSKKTTSKGKTVEYYLVNEDFSPDDIVTTFRASLKVVD